MAIGELVRLTQPAVWQVCQALGSPGEVEDLVQDTYLRALGGLDRYRGDAPVRVWLLSIARRVCADHVRSRQRRRRLVDRLARHATAGGRARRRRSSTTCWRLIDADRREAFVLTQLVGLSYEEAADVVGCPIGTIRSRVARARADLARDRRPLRRPLIPTRGPHVPRGRRVPGRGAREIVRDGRETPRRQAAASRARRRSRRRTRTAAAAITTAATRTSAVIDLGRRVAAAAVPGLGRRRRPRRWPWRCGGGSARSSAGAGDVVAGAVAGRRRRGGRGPVAAVVAGGAADGRRGGLRVVDVDDGDELVAPGASSGTSSMVAAGRRAGGQHEHAGRRELVVRVAADPRQLGPVGAQLDGREREQRARRVGGHELDRERALLVGRQHAAGPLEHGVAGAVRRRRRRPALDVLGDGVGERRPDPHGHRRRLAAPVRRLQRHRRLGPGRHGDQVALGVGRRRTRAARRASTAGTDAKQRAPPPVVWVRCVPPISFGQAWRRPRTGPCRRGSR